MAGGKRFSGASYFEQVEPKERAELLEEIVRCLGDLHRQAKGPMRGRVRSFLVQLTAAVTDERGESRLALSPAHGTSAAGSSTGPRAARESIGLDVLLLRDTIARFDEGIRSGSRLTGSLRIAVERVWVTLTALEMFVLRFHEKWSPAVLDRLRSQRVEGFWSEVGAVPSPDDPEFRWQDLSLALRNSWVRMLLETWKNLNYRYLRSRLKPPAFELMDAERRYGQWMREARTIAISGWHLATHSWEEVVKTLKHEMAHQVVDELLGGPEGGPHGARFQEACRLLRIDGAASADAGRLERGIDSNDPKDRVIAKVQKLLALAQSSNQNEASLAMRKASELLLKYNVDLAEHATTRSFTHRCIGPVLTRREEYHRTLAAILADHFFVSVIWIESYLPLTDTSGVRLEIIGTPENLEIAEYVHDFLVSTLDRLWELHRDSPDHQGGRKTEFHAGLARGFLAKLEEQARQIRDERALVWKGDPQLDEHFTHLHPRTRTVRAAGVTRGADYHIGVQQGRKIQLHRGVGGAASAGGRLLPPGRGSGGT